MTDVIDNGLKEKLARLYEQARSKGHIGTGTYIEDRFPYVEIDSSDFPKEAPHQQFACSLYNAPDEERFSVRFERDLISRVDTYKRLVSEGKFLIFVFKDQVPEEFRPIEASHEYVEGYTESHLNGRQAQFAEAQRRGPEFFERYIRWFGRNYPKPEDDNSKKIFLEQLVPKEGIPILQEVGYL